MSLEIPSPHCKYPEDSIFYESWWDGANTQKMIAEAIMKSMVKSILVIMGINPNDVERVA